MRSIAVVLEAFVRAFKILVRDILCPILGMYLVLRLGQGAFEVPAIPIIGGIASALIGIPYWSRTDERNRGKGGEAEEEPRPRKKITITGSGIRWGDDDDGPSGS